MIEKTIVVGPFQCNCKLLACPKTGEAVLVDPGDEAPRILQALQGVTTDKGLPLRVRYLLHTHGHLDHIGASREIKESFASELQPLLAINREDEILYQALVTQGQLLGFRYQEPLPIDYYLKHDEELRIGELRLTMIHTPGHSPGSTCIRLHDDTSLGAKETLYSGDTLFSGSVGRTDLWGGDQETLFKSIHERILSLDGDTRLCPGHGHESLIGIEKHQNPFLRA